MALYMLSTDIASRLIRGKSRILDERIASTSPEELCISAISRGELLLGVSRQQTQEVMQGDPPIHPAAMEKLRNITHSVLAKLTPQEAKALRARFGIDLITEHTLEKVRSGAPTGSRSQERDLLRVVDQFLARVPCLPWDAAAATHFASVAVELHQVGGPMATTDTMVAGHAIAVGAVLVIGGENRFSRVNQLQTQNWTRRRTSQ